MFEIGASYTKTDIYAALGVPPEDQDGDWSTGYTQ
jgi:hypothetical protein